MIAGFPSHFLSERGPWEVVRTALGPSTFQRTRRLFGLLVQADSCRLITNRCPHHTGANRSTRGLPDPRTTRAERADPSNDTVRYSSTGVRAEDDVHPVRGFALCIWQAPRPAATFGSFWSLQKEPAGGREFGEKGILNLMFVSLCMLTVEN